MFSCCCKPNCEHVLEASTTAQNTFNPIRNIVDRGTVTPNAAKEVISLSLGDPTVFGNMKTHNAVTEAMKNVLMEGKANGYAASVGNEAARAAIAQRYRDRFHVGFNAEDIFIASGCSGALDLAISVLCSPESSAILIPKPGFTLYATLATSKGIHPLYYPLDPNKAWEVDLDAVEKILKDDAAGQRRIKAWVVTNPSNPCGSVYSQDHLLSILKLAKRYKVPIVADEIYEDMVFSDTEYVPLARLCQQHSSLAVPVLTCSGLAKRFLVPGWRFGWIALHEPSTWDLSPIRKGLFDLATLIIGANTLIQAALPSIFSTVPDAFYSDINGLLEANARLVSDKLSGIQGIRAIKPQGTLYMLVQVDFSCFNGICDDVHLYELLMSEESVSVLPGSIFGADGFFRIVYSGPEEKLSEACDRLVHFFQAHLKQ